MHLNGPCRYLSTFAEDVVPMSWLHSTFLSILFAGADFQDPSLSFLFETLFKRGTKWTKTVWRYLLSKVFLSHAFELVERGTGTGCAVGCRSQAGWGALGGAVDAKVLQLLEQENRAIKAHVRACLGGQWVGLKI